MLNLTQFLSNYSIKKQILIGFTPVALVLIYLLVMSSLSYGNFFQSLQDLERVTIESDNLSIIDNDISQLERNVLVYSYIGYEGVLKKIKFLQKKIKITITQTKSLIGSKPEVSERFSRLESHYDRYKVGFAELVKEKRDLIKYQNKLIELLVKEKNEVASISDDLLKKNKLESAYLTSQINILLLELETSLVTLELALDFETIRKSRTIIKNIDDLVEELSEKIGAKKTSTITKLNHNYSELFKNLVRVSRHYSNLINVVLAGKSLEMDLLIKEIQEIAQLESESISRNIAANISSSQTNFYIFSIFAILIGVMSSLVIAAQISKPVKNITNTLSSLSKGKDVLIPGANRKDEVGKMAVAAVEFSKMAEDLKHQTDELEEFFYRTSHDLRSPLISSISLLKIANKAHEKGNKEKTKKSIGLVVSSLVKLETLIEDILTLAQTKSLEEERKLVDFNMLVSETLEGFNHMENFDRLEIRTNIDITDKLLVKKTRLATIVENLISNAIKYQDTEETQSFVEINAYTQNDINYIEVIDNGLRIPVDKQDKIFGMFQRFHSQISFGSGLGLYMLKKSVYILNGEIKYEDTGNGSKFTVWFS